MKRIIAGITALLAGCATTLDPNYAIQIEAYRATVASQQAVELAKAQAEVARFQAIEAIAAYGNEQTRNTALLTLALTGRGEAAARITTVNLPQAPQTAEERAWKWTAVILPTASALAQSFFSYRANVHAIDAQRDTTVAGYNALGGLGQAGFSSNQNIAGAGFQTVSNVAGAGYGALASMQPPAPNITFNGTGVYAGRDGSYVGPNSGSNSGNSGRINSPDNNQRNCSTTLAPDGSTITNC